MSNNKITENQVNEILKNSEIVVNTLWGKCTVMAVQLPNGFTIVEHCGCVDPANYKEEIGKQICLDKIKNEIWKLEGYKLQCEVGKL